MTMAALTLATLAAGAVAVLADAALKGAVLLAVAAVAAVALRRASAAARHLLWSLALTAVLLVPVLSAVLPGWRVLPRWRVDATEGPAAQTPPAADVSVRLASVAPADVAPVPTNALDAAGGPRSGTPAANAAPPPPDRAAIAIVPAAPRQEV